MPAVKWKNWLLVVFILLSAAFLRLYQLGSADVLNDETLIAFRSVGYIDFFSSPYQTTPWEWSADVPWWAHLSFHDHPPVVFVLQHLLFLFLGPSVFVMRLPLALAGIGSVFLLFLIGKLLFDNKVGLISTGLLAVSSYHVWISRIGLQESMVIFFVLLIIYLFIKSLQSGAHWQWGIAFGLALMTKYTAVAVAPIIFFWLIFFRRDLFKEKKFWLAPLLSLLIFSPVVLYNIKLFQSTGHFDLQFSYLFGQNVEAWRYLPGKIQAGSLFDRLRNLIPSLYDGLLGPMFILFILSILIPIASFWRQFYQKTFDANAAEFQGFCFVLLGFSSFLLELLLIGPSIRFTVMIVPFVVLLVGQLLAKLSKVILISVTSLLLVIELFFTYNVVFAVSPIGNLHQTYSLARNESIAWGYNYLNDYVEKLVEEKQPALSFSTKYPFTERLKQAAIQQDKAENKTSSAILMIYDNRMYETATFWIFHRQLVYGAWPILTAQDYLNQGVEFWRAQGITDFYLFKILDNILLVDPESNASTATDEIISTLSDKKPLDLIKNRNDDPVFEVYHWQ
ncbi:MAG: glycosyltransferase family 39 protein [Patescibacteria group bacterium]|nr:glycosyltransferase family 39 protein [Patescibacteria group bacterium]